MSVVKKYEFKTSSGEVVSYDIGAEAGNVSVASGSDVETELGLKAAAVRLTSEDLDDVTTAGFYTANGSNTCANTPFSSSSAFGLEVVKIAGTAKHYIQTLWGGARGVLYRRWCIDGTWNDWRTAGGATGAFVLTSEDLDSITTAGLYTTGGNNTCTNTPLTSGYAFGMEVVRLANNDTYITQTLYSANLRTVYRRWCYGGTWGSWTELKFTDTTYSAATSSAAGLMSASDKAAVDNMQEYSTTAVKIGTWIDGSAIYRVAGTATIPSTGLSDNNEDTDISGVTSDNATAILRQEYYADCSHFGRYRDFYDNCVKLYGGTVYYCVEYVE